MNTRYLVSRERFIAAPAEVIFDVLATPALHSAIDGSGTVKGAQPRGPERKVFLRPAGYLRRHPVSIEKTLARLEEHVAGAAR